MDESSNAAETLELPMGGESVCIGAAVYIAAFVYPTELQKRQAFLAAIAECSQRGSQNRKLGRSARRAIDRATNIINEIRIPAAVIGSELSLRLEKHTTVGKAIRISVEDDLTVRSVALRHLADLPKYNTLPNFFHHVWRPSKSVLHMGIAFIHHAGRTANGVGPAAQGRPGRRHGPQSLVRLIAEPSWLPDACAMRNSTR